MNFIKEGNFYFTEETQELFLIASSFESSLRNDQNVIDKLKDLNFKGEVYVDMLLVKGIVASRFFKFYFNGQRFETNKTQKINSNTNNILNKFQNIERTFCISNKGIIENSCLSYSEKLIVYG